MSRRHRSISESGNRKRGLRVVHSGRRWVAVLAALLAAAAVTAAAVAGQPVIALGAVVVAVAWLASAVRVRRLVPAGGSGPDSPPGAGVREPRRPLPLSPAGAAEMNR